MAQKIDVRGIKVTVLSDKKDDYISLSDIAKYKDGERSDYILQNWIRNRSTIEFIGLWEQLHNPGFNSIEFDGFKNEAGSNSFSLTPKRWITTTNAVETISKPAVMAVLMRIRISLLNSLPGSVQNLGCTF